VPMPVFKFSQRYIDLIKIYNVPNFDPLGVSYQSLRRTLDFVNTLESFGSLGATPRSRSHCSGHHIIGVWLGPISEYLQGSGVRIINEDDDVGEA